MALVRNAAATKFLRDVSVLKTGENLDLQILPGVQPVIDILAYNTRAISTSLLNAANATVYTAPLTGQTWLTAATMCVTRDATATSSGVVLEVQTGTGENCNILSVPGFTLTAHGPVTTALPFFRPILIRPGGTIRLISSTAIANIFARAAVTVVEMSE